MPSRFQHLPPPRASLPLQARELLRSPVEPHTDGLKPPVSPKKPPLHLPMRLPSHIPPPCLHRWAPAGARNAAEASAPWHLPSLPVTFPLYLGQKAGLIPCAMGTTSGLCGGCCELQLEPGQDPEGSCRGAPSLRGCSWLGSGQAPAPFLPGASPSPFPSQPRWQLG